MNLLSNLVLKIALWCNHHVWHPVRCASSNQSENGNNVNETPTLDVYLYSMNLSQSQENQSVPCAIPDANELKLWKNQSYGILVASQDADKSETVPIWQDINERLKNVDLYLKAVTERLMEVDGWYNVEVNLTGVSGILKFHSGTNNTNERPLMYSLDTYRKRTVSIPKLIYRVIRGEWHHDGVQNYEAVIIIHNDPRSRYNIDGLNCDRILSWDVIENLFNETGLAYVCRPTEEINRVLGINCSTEAKSLELSTIPLYYSEHPLWDWTYPYESIERDYTDDIYQRYVELRDRGNRGTSQSP